MNPRMIVKVATDIAMTAALLFLMTYGLIGEAVHEWIGVAMFVLFILHHILNSHWSRNLFKGKYTAIRLLQTILVIFVLVSMLASMFSGLILSRHVFSSITIRGWRSFARSLHMISAYWGFVLMSLHLGLHWNIMMGMVRKFVQKPSTVCTWVLRANALLVAGYGVYAFIYRGVGRYMLMWDHFVFFDFDEPLLFFLLDYLCIMSLFVWIGHYAAAAIRRCIHKRKAA